MGLHSSNPTLSSVGFPSCFLWFLTCSQNDHEMRLGVQHKLRESQRIMVCIWRWKEPGYPTSAVHIFCYIRIRGQRPAICPGAMPPLPLHHNQASLLFSIVCSNYRTLGIESDSQLFQKYIPGLLKWHKSHWFKQSCIFKIIYLVELKFNE